ncbi:MAG TPA: hypothetical protein VJN70_20020, partial [Gemmatimonadaceae bacterium]|nr:hypothetical protein [Gemmatimonadaceae bacterium]
MTSKTICALILVVAIYEVSAAQTTGARVILAAGRPAQLEVRVAGEHSIRVTLRPFATPESAIISPALAEREYPAPAISLREVSRPTRARVGGLTVEVQPDPLSVIVTNARGENIQSLIFESDGSLSFHLDGQPVLGLGEGAQRPEQGTPWREQAIQFDRRGRLYAMEPRWQSGPYGSRNPAAMLVGTGGW